MLLHKLNGFVIHREDTVFTAGLYRHIGYGKSVIHRKSSYTFARKFHTAIKCSVNTDFANDI